MKQFQQNIERFNKVTSALAPHGLVLAGGCVVDTQTPHPMNTIVCRFEHQKIDLDKPFDVSDYPIIVDFLNGGREQAIRRFYKEQAEAADWHNRPR